MLLNNTEKPQCESFEELMRMASSPSESQIVNNCEKESEQLMFKEPTKKSIKNKGIWNFI